MVDASEIEVSVEKSEVTLTGTVQSRDQRRRAEDCVESISGVKHVQNNLRVEQGQGQIQPLSGTTSSMRESGALGSGSQSTRGGAGSQTSTGSGSGKSSGSSGGSSSSGNL